MVQLTTLAIALAATASSVSAFKVACVKGEVYCGFHLNAQPTEYTFPELQAAARAGGAANPSIDYIQSTLFTCVDDKGGISTDIPEDHCDIGKCIWWFPGNPQCPGVDCCVA